MNIIIPMAGNGTRVDSELPKPLCKIVDNKTMIRMAIESLNLDGNYCFIVRKYENEDWNEIIKEEVNSILGSATFVEIDYLTNGPACSALLAPSSFFEDEQLLITNCDQIMRWDADKFAEFISNTDASGVVVTYYSQTPKNSYAMVYDWMVNDMEQYPQFSYVKEKEVISTYSLNGIHWWKSGHLFSSTAKAMMDHNDTVNGEYYIGPTFSYLSGIKRVYQINDNEHFAVGTTEDIEDYKRLYENR